MATETARARSEGTPRRYFAKYACQRLWQAEFSAVRQHAQTSGEYLTGGMQRRIWCEGIRTVRSKTSKSRYGFRMNRAFSAGVRHHTNPWGVAQA